MIEPERFKHGGTEENSMLANPLFMNCSIIIA